MSDDPRIARLEARVQVLERLVRDLVAGRGASVPDAAPFAPPPPPPAPPPRPWSGHVDDRGAPVDPPQEPTPAPRPVPPHPPAPRPPQPAAPASGRSPGVLNEQWLGSRGLLAVGVVFLVLAAGYLLKLSFDRGWVSPLARCIGGAAGGVVVGLVGWRLHGRGLRTYGAALLGAGAAIIYLAVWAAAQLYQFLPATQALVALALVSVGLAAVAWAIGVEALLATAALGAFFAPLLAGPEAGNANMLLGYLGSMGVGFGAVAAQRHWRVAMGIVALAYFGIALPSAADKASALPLWLYGIGGGAAGLFVGLREGWWETRFLSFSGGWAFLAAADAHTAAAWPNLAGALVLAAPVWWRAFQADLVWPGRSGPNVTSTKEGMYVRPFAFGETFYFYVTPLAVAVALWSVDKVWFGEHPGAAAALVALPYLVAGYQQERRPFAIVAVGALAWAAVLQEDVLLRVWLLAILGLATTAADRLLHRRDGRILSLLVYAGALYVFGTDVLPAREAADPAFTSAFALTLWLLVATAVVQAAILITDEAYLGELSVRLLYWGAAGLLLFLGVSAELMRAFGQSAMAPDQRALAGGLAVSAWWILYAGACFAVGFRRQLRGLRLTGFAVAGLAVAKVVLVDLSTLDALYRVGSALILGLVSLAIAYAYHRRAPG